MTYHYAQASLGISRFSALVLTGIGVLLTIAQAFLIISTRHHYSSDVIVALYVTPMLFYWFTYSFEKEDAQPDHERIAQAIQLHPSWLTSLNPPPIIAVNDQ